MVYFEVMMVSITIKAILPEKSFASRRWLQKMATAQRTSSVSKLRGLFQQTVFGWSVKPSMGWSQETTSDAITLRIYPTGAGSDVWALVNEGSPAHVIAPKSYGGMLRFRPGYKSATTPGSLQSRRAYRSGKISSVPPAGRAINHPGFEPRKFTVLIAQEFASEFALDMQEAIIEASK